ncbi:MAG: hypothetical protein J5647_09975 [Spirochaetaceae bacterium]|nr:hypothetical protein [Spirochaetaceae bacterium]
MKIGLSSSELKKRTSKDYLSTKIMLKKDAPEYTNLADGDKAALKHLVKAAVILEEVYLKMDDARNIPFRDYLKAEIKKSNADAKLAMKLFKAQKGINAVDMNADKFSLLRGAKELPGKGLYPADLTKEEFHAILKTMLAEGKKEEVAKILNQRSVIVRDGKALKALDYTEAFKKEFRLAARHILQAAETSTNKDFNEFLQLQAKALTVCDPMADAYADKKWASLQDTPLEFTITRENYEDEMTETVYENEELSALLKKNGIEAVSKDMLGFRVGIVNKEGTDKLLEIKKYLPELAKNMPYADKYKQNITVAGAAQDKGDAGGSGSDDIKQNMVDVDIVTVKGDVGAYRAGITLAENLPNYDKLSIKIGGGRRNVYHRQIRAVSDRKWLQKLLDATLDKNLHQFFENEANHWFTIGHENGHSLGPNSGTEVLGKYKSIIEENKADMISMAMIDKLVELGMYTELQKKQIITIFAVDCVLKAKPNLSQAHRVRTVMQLYHFLKTGAFTIKNGVITINYEKVVPAAAEMLKKIIEVQISGSFEKGEQYVLENFIWSDEIEKLAAKMRKVNKTLNGTVKEELANWLAR